MDCLPISPFIYKK